MARAQSCRKLDRWRGEFNSYSLEHGSSDGALRGVVAGKIRQADERLVLLPKFLWTVENVRSPADAR